VMSNLSARSVMEASARPRCSKMPRRIGSDSFLQDRGHRWGGHLAGIDIDTSPPYLLQGTRESLRMSLERC
jgi:hypothetical protein